MLCYYLEKGIPAEHILSLSPTSKMFYMASMLRTLEAKKKAADEISNAGRR